jgi:MoaA/NifB/PqqE/SkfB family radical SAM enzyme
MAERPLWLWIDPTRECGLKCNFCYTKLSHNTDHLTPGDLRRYFDILLSDPGVVIQKLNFNWRGDPLMNPEILELLAEVEARNFAFPMEFHTNGTTIDEATARALVSIVREIEIFVSIDGGNQISHDFNRGAGTYAKALSGLDLLLRARGASASPRIGLFQLDLGVPEEDYDPEFSRLASLVDEWVRINPIHPGSGRRIQPRLPVSLRAGGQGQHGLPPAQPTDRWWAREVPQGGEQPQGPCFWAGNAFFIAPRGDVSVCLLSHSADGVIGNLLSMPLSEILDNSAKYRAEITRLGRSGIPHCAKCMVFEGEAKPEI